MRLEGLLSFFEFPLCLMQWSFCCFALMRREVAEVMSAREGQ